MLSKLKATILIILLLAMATILSMFALTVTFSSTSPFNCGSNCSGFFEIFEYDEGLCYAFPGLCFNTIDACFDGESSEFEWIEDINISSHSGASFEAGGTVTVDILADCDPQEDWVAIAYSNGSDFKNMHSETCSVNDQVHILYNLTLDNVEGTHTIRAMIAYPGESSMTCGADSPNPEFSDTDDVSFEVQATPDTTPPSVTNILPTAGSTYQYQEGLEVNICADIADDTGIDSVFANVTWNDQEYYMEILDDELPRYCDYFTEIDGPATYNITIYAKDIDLNLNSTERSNFTVYSASEILIISPIQDQTYVYGASIPLNFTAIGDYNISTASYSLDGGSQVEIVGGRSNVSFTAWDADGRQGTSTYNRTNTTMSFQIQDKLNFSQVQLSIQRNGTATGTLTVLNSTGFELANGTLNTGNATNFTLSIVTLNATLNLATGNYTLRLNSQSNETDFITWEHNDDGTYDLGSSSTDPAVDFLFAVFDSYAYKTQISGLEKGAHSISVFATSDTAGPISSDPLNFTVDSTAPAIHSYNYTPNTSALLDPGRAINFSANISDGLSVSAVLLQYRQDNSSTYTNNTAALQSGLYRANATIPSDGTWLFRIKAIDTSGNEQNTSEVSLNVSYEYNWNITPTSLGGISAQLLTNASMGNITILNNADFSLNVTIGKTTGTVPEVYINGSETANISLQSGTNTTLPLTATGLSTQSESSGFINLSATSAASTPANYIVNFTLVTFTSGPYLRIDILEYDPAVAQGQERVAISASITNFGNQTAYNVTAQVSVPSGWSPKTNTSQNYSSLSEGQSVTFTRFFDVDSSASTGDQEISISVNSSGGHGDIEQRTVAVSGVSSSSGSSSGGGRRSGGGGGIPITRIPELTVTTPSHVEISRGSNATMEVTIENTGQTDFHNLSISLEGHSILHFSIDPWTVDRLKANESAQVAVSIEIPEYEPTGRKEINLTVTATTEGKLVKYTSRSELVTYSLEREGSSLCLASLESTTSIFESLGLAGYASDRLALIEVEIERKEYTIALAICEQLKADAKIASQINDQLSAIMMDPQANEEVLELASIAREALSRGEIGQAQERIADAESLLSQLVLEKQAPSLTAAGKYWKEILLLSMIVSLSAFTASRYRSFVSLDRKDRSIAQAESKLKEEMAQVQAAYFSSKEMSKRDYEQAMERLRQGFAQVESQKCEVDLQRLKALKRKDDVKVALKHAQEARQRLQARYFKQKAISSKQYENLNAEYNRIISELEVHR